MVNVEAMAAGKPMVASNVGGIPEIVIDGETGILVEPANPIKLAEALDLLVIDQERFRLKSRPPLAKEVLKTRAPGTIADIYSIYNETINI